MQNISEASEIADKLERDPREWGGLSLGWKAAAKLRELEAAVKELAETLEDLADYAGAFSVDGVYLVEDKHARALLDQAYKLVLKYDN